MLTKEGFQRRSTTWGAGVISLSEGILYKHLQDSEKHRSFFQYRLSFSLQQALVCLLKHGSSVYSMNYIYTRNSTKLITIPFYKHSDIIAGQRDFPNRLSGPEKHFKIAYFSLGRNQGTTPSEVALSPRPVSPPL